MATYKTVKGRIERAVLSGGNYALTFREDRGTSMIYAFKGNKKEFLQGIAGKKFPIKVEAKIVGPLQNPPSNAISKTKEIKIVSIF